MKILLINPPKINFLSYIKKEKKDVKTGKTPKFSLEKFESVPPLGLLYIAAYLEKYTDYSVQVIDCIAEGMDYERLRVEIGKGKPDVVGITVLTLGLVDVIKTARLVKEINPEIKIVLGGPHINIFPEETMRFNEFDYLVLGEGEYVFKELLDNLGNKDALYKIQGIVFRDGEKIVNSGTQPFIKDLDSLPFPARHMTSYRKHFSTFTNSQPATTMITSRGCPYKCTFCDRPQLGKNFRARSAGNVVDEMELCKKMGISEIIIYDDTFTVERQRVMDICSEIRKRKLDIAWNIRTRVDKVDEEMLVNLKKAGCQFIYYGVESGVQKIIDAFGKNVTLEQIKETFRLTRKTGIKTLSYFMIGNPGETIEDVKQSIKFMKKLKSDFVIINILTPFPATALYRQGLEQKILPFDFWKKFVENPDKDFVPMLWEENFNSKKLNALHKKAYISFYFRPVFIIKHLAWIISLTKIKSSIKLIFSKFE